MALKIDATICGIRKQGIETGSLQHMDQCLNRRCQWVQRIPDQADLSFGNEKICVQLYNSVIN